MAAVLSSKTALCQICLRNLESLIALREKLRQEEKIIDEQVQRAGVRVGLE